MTNTQDSIKYSALLLPVCSFSWQNDIGKCSSTLGVTAHAYNPSTRRLEACDYCKDEASQGTVVRFSQNKKEKEKKKKPSLGGERYFFLYFF